jgi:hypothetical protein
MQLFAACKDAADWDLKMQKNTIYGKFASNIQKDKLIGGLINPLKRSIHALFCYLCVLNNK